MTTSDRSGPHDDVEELRRRCAATETAVLALERERAMRRRSTPVLILLAAFSIGAIVLPCVDWLVDIRIGLPDKRVGGWSIPQFRVYSGALPTAVGLAGLASVFGRFGTHRYLTAVAAVITIVSLRSSRLYTGTPSEDYQDWTHTGALQVLYLCLAGVAVLAVLAALLTRRGRAERTG